MNTSNIIIALGNHGKRYGRNLCHSDHHSLCMASRKNRKNKYSNISIALLFSSPDQKRAKVTCSIDLGSIFY